MREYLSNILGKGVDNVKDALSIWLFKVRPTYIFSFLLALTLFWAYFLPSLKFNYDIESFFSSEDPEVEFYHQHRDTFENENDFLLVGLKNRHGIFQKAFLKKTDSLTNILKQFSRIEKVISPTNIYETIKSPWGSFRIPLLHVNEPDRYASDKSRIYSSGLYMNSFFSTDSQSVSLLIRKEGSLSKEANDSLLLALNHTIASHNFDEFHIAGRIHTQHYYVGLMKKQMSLFAGSACILFIISLFLIFRDVRYVLLSLGAVLIALVWILGLIGWLGVQIDLMLTLLPSLIFIISTSNSIHLLSRFRNEYHTDTPKLNALKAALFETGMPNFLTAFTTAIGFASLVMIPVPPIHRFGLLVSLGIIMSFMVNILLIPAALRIMPLKPSVNSDSSGKHRYNVFHMALNKPRWITGTFVLIILTGIFFSFKVKVNNHFLDDLNPQSSLKQDLDFFEQNFSGIRPFEINIQSKDSNSILTHTALMELDTVEKHLKSAYRVGFLFSPLTFIKSINKAINGGNQEYYRIPDSQQELNEVLKLANKQKIWKRFLPVLNKDQSIGRITGRTKDEGSRILGNRNKKLQAFLKEHTHHLKYTITGAAQLMDNANSHIARNLTKGILLAVFITTLVISLFTGSWKLALLSIVPNIFPLLMVSGYMGATGVPLKVATSLLFTIAYGIAVDNTIHFLNSYRLNQKLFADLPAYPQVMAMRMRRIRSTTREQGSDPDLSPGASTVVTGGTRKGFWTIGDWKPHYYGRRAGQASNHEAIRQTISKMWRPMLYTSVVLLSGFMIFTFSEFSSIFLLGYLISGSLVGALLADLLFLPVLLRNILPSNFHIPP